MDAGVWANLGLEERGPAWGQESISIRQASVQINSRGAWTAREQGQRGGTDDVYNHIKMQRAGMGVGVVQQTANSNQTDTGTVVGGPYVTQLL